MDPLKNTSQNRFEIEQEINLKEELRKYSGFWPWFVLGITLAIFTSFLYLRYTPITYQTIAKVRILDEKESLELPSASSLFSQSKINLENEIEGLKSYPILEEVSNRLNLHANFYAVGHIKSSRLTEFPFAFELKPSAKSFKQTGTYLIEFNSSGLEVFTTNLDSLYQFDAFQTKGISHDLPFEIVWDESAVSRDENESYRLELTPVSTSVNDLKKVLSISTVGKKSEIISIGQQSENTEYAESIINALIEVYNQDGVDDRRLVHKHTIDFINERFVSLGYELDSIEFDKQSFKLENNLVDITTDAGISLELRSKSDQELFQIENQIGLSELLMQTASNEATFSLYPSNIGLENVSINALIDDYNQKILTRNNLVRSGGENNPNVKNLTHTILEIRENIIQSVAGYTVQLKQTKEQLKVQSRKYQKEVSSLPEKEKILRSIERSQEIQESLYLFLLQKREEAEVSYAVTEPSLKVVEYALSSEEPISPKKPFVLLGSILLGLLIPFGIIYIRFLLNTKIQSKKDLESSLPNSSVLGEIPEIKEDGEKLFSNPNERSVLAEASRILSSNTNYLLGANKKDEGSVILCTSTIKGEGKTFVALNLSLALASLNKKVLLIGADLRNPQIHNYVSVEKRVDGLSNYLYDDSFDWKSALLKPFKEHPTHAVLIGGNLPPNPVQLLTNGRLDSLLSEAKKSYDYIIMDCAPTLLVTDTLLISHLADATVYLTRANHTEKELLEYPKQLIEDEKLKNVGFVINGLGAGNSYGYGYGYKYGYNYGYGYGYGSES
jgi:capsular exopolysaccharide synthesis family protein